MARESRETGARPRRRNHLMAAAAILAVIVAVGLMLEFMPGSGPTVTATPKPVSGRAHPVAGGKTANPHAAMTGSPHAAKAANPHAAKQDDVKDAKAADTKDAKAAEAIQSNAADATRSAAADAKDAKAADTNDGKAADSKVAESKDGKSETKSVVSVTPFGRAFTQGIEAMRSGDAHAAAQAFDQARAINPHIPEAHINLGFAFLAMKRPNEAAKAFDEALAIDPKQVNAYYGLGAALDGVGDREGAMGAMRSYIHLADENDKFRRKAMAAVWEWEAELKAAAEKKAAETKAAGTTAGGENKTADAKTGEESKSADAKSGAEAAQAAAASKDAAGGTTPVAADAVEKSAPANVASGVASPPTETAALPDSAKPVATKSNDTPGPATQAGTAAASATAEPAKADAKPTTVAALQSPAPRDPAAPAPLPDITQVPGGLTPPEGMIHIVNVWASWCGPCRAELPSLQKMAAALDPKRYRVIGLNIDKDRDFAREFIRDTGVSFDNFWDGKGVYARERYKTESYPQTLFLNSSGAVLARIVGAREWPVEAADAAVAEMLAAGGQPKEAK